MSSYFSSYDSVRRDEGINPSRGRIFVATLSCDYGDVSLLDGFDVRMPHAFVERE